VEGTELRQGEMVAVLGESEVREWWGCQILDGGDRGEGGGDYSCVGGGSGGGW
jgi:hypothetical protein